MNKKIIIQLDMDGVIVNFNKAVCDHFDKNYLEVMNNWVPGDYSTAKQIGITDDILWNELNTNQDFWHDMEPYDYAFELVVWLQSRFETHICTSPTRNKHCFSGKYAWICQHIPSLKENLTITKNKHLLANPYTVLIDDSDEKINKFKDYGGQFFLFPQCWNSAHRITSTEQKLKDLKEFLLNV